MKLNCEYQACIDCMLYIANNDYQDDSIKEAVQEKEKLSNGGLYIGDDYELGFSKCGCDICHSKLCGDRFLIHGYSK